MLNIGVEFEALNNPEIVARCQLFQELGDAVWVLAGENDPELVFEKLDEIGFDCGVVYGEKTRGYEIIVGRACGEGRDIGSFEKSTRYRG